MREWDVVRCADHHFRRVIYGLGPYIADYPEQTVAAGTVYGWCVTLVWPYFSETTCSPVCRCDADSKNLDDPDANLRTQERTTLLLKNEEPELLWYEHGIVPEFQVYPCPTALLLAPTDVSQPFMMRFPRADIHELLTSDLLHQAIKGTYKDHLVQWVEDYLKGIHGPTRQVQSSMKLTDGM